MLLVLSSDDYYITLTEILSEKGNQKNWQICSTPCSLLTLQVFVTRNQSLLLLKG